MTEAPDIRLVQNLQFPENYEVSLDWQLLSDGRLDDRQALATAVILALGTDGLVDANDILPDPDETDRGGWWGDLDAQEIWGAWPIGSRMRLLRRTKMTGPGAYGGSIVTRAEQYIREALQPFIDRRIASRMDVFVNVVNTERMDALIRLYRGPRVEVDLRYQILWDDL